MSLCAYEPVRLKSHVRSRSSHRRHAERAATVSGPLPEV